MSTIAETGGDERIEPAVVRPTGGRPKVMALLPAIIAVALLVALPFVFPSRTALAIAAAIGINVVFALSYNMQLGQGGMLSFGHAVAYGFGGYAAIHLMVMIDKQALPLPIFFVPIAGFAFGLLVGAILGWPICRRGGTAFAMITLGIGELVAAASLMFTTFFGGEEGIKADRVVGPEMFGLSLGPPIGVYWFIAFWTFVGALAMWAFTRTPLGRLSNAVRDNPDRVRFIGYDPSRVRHLVYTVSSGFAGLAGGMTAVNFEILTPTIFSALVSGSVLLMAFIGGLGVFYGPVLGAILITVMQSMLSDYTEAWQFYVGLLFVAVVLFAPGGIGGIIEQARAASRRGEVGRMAPVWLARLAATIVLVFGVALLVELAFAASHGSTSLGFFGVALNPRSALPWIVAVVVIALAVLAGKRAPRLLREGERSQAAGVTP